MCLIFISITDTAYAVIHAFFISLYLQRKLTPALSEDDIPDITVPPFLCLYFSTYKVSAHVYIPCMNITTCIYFTLTMQLNSVESSWSKGPGVRDSYFCVS